MGALLLHTHTHIHVCAHTLKTPLPSDVIVDSHANVARCTASPFLFCEEPSPTALTRLPSKIKLQII